MKLLASLLPLLQIPTHFFISHDHSTLNGIGRGIEYSNGRSKHVFRDRCKHTISACKTRSDTVLVQLYSHLNLSWSTSVARETTVDRIASVSCQRTSKDGKCYQNPSKRVGQVLIAHIYVFSYWWLWPISYFFVLWRFCNSYTSFILSDAADDDTDTSPHRSPGIVSLCDKFAKVSIPVPVTSCNYVPSYLHRLCPSHCRYVFVLRTVAMCTYWPPRVEPLSL